MDMSSRLVPPNDTKPDFVGGCWRGLEPKYTFVNGINIEENILFLNFSYKGSRNKRFFLMAVPLNFFF